MRWQPSCAVTVILALFKLVGCTERPIIGVVCHENEDKSCYIAASYVKAVEQSGARVVPIFLGRDEQYYRKMVEQLNGMVFPGGDAPECTTGGYFEAGSIIYNIVREMNAAGDNIPILGVCLGLEFLAYYSNGEDCKNTLVRCNGMANGKSLKLQFENGFENSSLFGDAPKHIIDILSKQNVTANYHDYCLRPNKKLKHPWHILTINQDADGLDFVSSMEVRGQPIVAIQFHPEKNPYEWERKNPSFLNALVSARYFYDWLVVEARKNQHRFANMTDEKAALIYNYSPEYSGLRGSAFEQKYVFL